MSTLVAFFIGWVARLVLLSHLGLTPYDYDYTTNINDNDADAMALVALPTSGGMSKKKIDGLEEFAPGAASGKKSTQLPSPKIIEGKDVPFTTYASKTFQMAGVATSNTLHIDRSTALLMGRSRKEFDGGPDFTTQSDEGVSDGDGWVPCDEKACSRGKEKERNDDGDTSAKGYDSHNDDSDGMHLPAGQHLLVDIKDVDSNFLNSEERLAHAMIELINESKLTLLSYHCHSLVPIGVSCAGVLLESHVAFHTWPMEGVITMDLFTCGGGLLIPTLPSIERLFGVSSTLGEGEDPEVPRPTMLWSHKLRGFREGFAPGYVRSKNALDGSLGRYVLGKLDFDMKRPLLSTTTEIQNVNIYEVMEPKNRDYNSYYRSLEGGDSYEATYPESFGPDKILFLDDVLQSTLYGDAACHESIVHPAMIAHARPRRVAIIGGGEGATLREVLKHRSVEEVVILEIDRELVEICAEYMPEWSDCGDIEGSDAGGSCFDDSRARLVYADAFKWFIDKFGKTEGEEERAEERFDVIIMDALDPNTSIEIAGGLYNDTSFIDSVFSGLAGDGVFVVQLGKSKMSTDPPDEIGRFKDTALMIDALEESGFESIHTYDEGHSHFYMPWSYLVAFKEYKSRAGWHRTAPEIQIELQKRLVKTKSGKPVLRYFDAATMIGYQMPPKSSETVFCRKEEKPHECEFCVGLDEIVNFPASEYLKVGKSELGDLAGRGLFAAKDIPEDVTLALADAGKSFHFSPLSWSVVEKLYAWADEDGNYDKIPFVEDEIIGVWTFVDGYGHGSLLLGELHMSIESDVMLFMNHGCNGTYNYAATESDSDNRLTEMNIDFKNIGEIVENFINKSSHPYSPVFDRNWRMILNSGDCSLRDIKAGEEILTDYLTFAGSIDDFRRDVMSLRRQCVGEGVGVVQSYTQAF
mmetsp:Transcript_46741/g.99177  ORF Transcript_46741/g.99177 Transcript_46741/m.99177 type:complete len:920 (-) Transcript_46741:286-3045(-)